MVIGELIKKSRLEAGYETLGDLHRASGVPVATLSRIESGTQVPSPPTLEKLAPFIRVGHKELLIAAGYLKEEQHPSIVAECSVTDKITIDPELNRIIKYLTGIWESGDERLKAWASVQFERAFPEVRKIKDPDIPWYLKEIKKGRSLDDIDFLCRLIAEDIVIVSDASIPISPEQKKGFIKYIRNNPNSIPHKNRNLVDIPIAAHNEGDPPVLTPEYNEFLNISFSLSEAFNEFVKKEVKS